MEPRSNEGAEALRGGPFSMQGTGSPNVYLDGHDDRLADLLEQLAQAEPWQALQADLNQHTVRVYHLATSPFRIDTTTASSYAGVVAEDGLLQFGHSKGDPSLPQRKVSACALDPLGLPVTSVVVAGHVADDPLYIPEIQQVHASFGPGWPGLPRWSNQLLQLSF